MSKNCEITKKFKAHAHRLGKTKINENEIHLSFMKAFPIEISKASI